MKKLFSLLAIVFCVAVSAQAQVPTYAWNSVTFGSIAADSNTNFASPLFIDCSKQGNIAFQIAPTSGTGTSNIVYYLAPSVDKLTYDTNNAVVLTAPGNRTTVTNVSCPGIGGFYLFRATNNFAGSIVTNSFKYSIKISAE